ncbi:MAG: glycosyltransferase family 2 protein [Chloroflexi bacterium]|jgi:hypothetical protein|nr:glycosyltransferase family 2 protein [Chloroflexota bacterium]
MPLLTIFTAPKPFTNPHIDTIQRNAIQSWLQLGPDVEVFLIGEEAGLAEVAREFGVTHLPDVRRNSEGTPLVSSIFDLARQASSSPLLAYVNADIILLPDFVTAARQVMKQAEQFLIVGQRWDLDVRSRLDFSPGWEERLRTDLNARGRLHPPAGSDYFIFPRALFTEMPEFAIGRAGWDNWMIYHARKQGFPTIDATPSIQIVHQDHDYSHLPGGRPHYDLEESSRNMALAGGSQNMYIVLDTDKQFSGGRIHAPRLTVLRVVRRAELWLTPANGKRQGPRWAAARVLRRFRRRRTKSRL